MSTQNERLREARIAAGYKSAAQAAEALGVNYQTYAGHENAKSGFRSDSALRYSRKFRVRLEWLLTGRGEMRPGGVEAVMTYERAFGLPVVGTVAAGYWLDTSMQLAQLAADDEDRQHLPVLADERFKGEQYVLECRGDSMNKLFPDGSYVICVDFASSGLGLKDGMVAHVERTAKGGELVEITLKQIERHRGKWRLLPRSTNPKWKAINLDDGGEDDEVRVRGIVIGVYQQLTI